MTQQLLTDLAKAKVLFQQRTILAAMGVNPRHWQDINSAPRDREIELRAWYEPSAEAARNGAKAQWMENAGHCIYEGLWSGVLGGKPSHWRELLEQCQTCGDHHENSVPFGCQTGDGE